MIDILLNIIFFLYKNESGIQIAVSSNVLTKTFSTPDLNCTYAAESHDH